MMLSCMLPLNLIQYEFVIEKVKATKIDSWYDRIITPWIRDAWNGMMTLLSENGIRFKHLHDDVMKWKHFRITGPLCGEFTVHWWIPLTRASDAELWCFRWSTRKKRLSKQSGDLIRHSAHYDVTVMWWRYMSVEAYRQIDSLFASL